MRRALALTLGLLAGLGLPACLDYDDELYEYCARQGTCFCEGGSCCAAKSQPCSQALECCEGTFCSGRRLCEGPVVLSFPVLPAWEQRVWRGSTIELKLINHGAHASLPIQVVAEGDATRFLLDASGCTGKPLGGNAQCLVRVTNTSPPPPPQEPNMPPPPDAPLRIRVSEQGGPNTAEQFLGLVQQ